MGTVPPAGPSLEVADILRTHGPAYGARHPISPEQATVLRHLVACRTAALGGHVDTCTQCGLVRISYNSCRDRHCPKCQATQREQWIEARLERVLPVEHFHVVFTLPDPLNPLMLRNRAALYNLLFAAASRTLLELADDPKRLGAQVGFTAILHTWGQNLLFHPHLHCVVTAGGVSPDGARWVPTREDYLLPVKVLGRLFRGKFLAGLNALYQEGGLTFAGSTAGLTDPRVFAALRDRLYRQDWVVYAKPPFGGTEQVFRYLGRYSHRVALSNSRLVSLENGIVAFRYKDYRDASRWKVMHLGAEEFIRRFLLHVLPKRFVRIRHYGLLAGRNVNGRLEQARRLLGDPSPKVEPPPALAPTWQDRVLTRADPDPRRCPSCRGPLIRRPLSDRPRPPGTVPLTTAAAPARRDSS
jgi:hypothetical protein